MKVCPFCNTPHDTPFILCPSCEEAARALKEKRGIK